MQPFGQPFVHTVERTRLSDSDRVTLQQYAILYFKKRRKEKKKKNPNLLLYIYIYPRYTQHGYILFSLSIILPTSQPDFTEG